MSESRWHELQGSSVLAILETAAETGLTANQVRTRRLERGYKKLTHKQNSSALKTFVNQFRDVLILILLATVVSSVLAGEAVDALIILIIVVFCTVPGCLQGAGGAQADADAFGERPTRRQAYRRAFPGVLLVVVLPSVLVAFGIGLPQGSELALIGGFAWA